MVRTYVRKSTRQSWDEIAMPNAVDAVKKGEMGVQKASVTFGVPKTTLRRRARNKNKRVNDGAKDLGGRGSKLCEAMEIDLVSYIVRIEEKFFGLTMEDVRKLAYQLAVRNGLIRSESKEDSFGKDWLKGFLRRHREITPRTPEATSAARARGFNRIVVGKFFDMYESLIDKYRYYRCFMYERHGVICATTLHFPPTAYES